LFSLVCLVFKDVNQLLLSIPKKIKPNDALLHIYMCKFNRDIFETSTHFFICCAILTCIGKNMTKMTSLIDFLQTNRFTINNWFQCIGHCVEVWALIFDIRNIFSLKPYLSKTFVKLQTKAYPIVVVTSNSPILTCLGYQSFPKKLMTKDTSYAPLDIQRSKQVVAKWYFANARKT